MSLALRAMIEESASKHGLQLLGIVSLDVFQDYERFQKWLSEGKHAGMSFLENYPELRRDPTLLMPGAKNAIILGFCYQQGDKLNDFLVKTEPWLAQYARFKDYHKFLRKACEDIQKDISETVKDLNARFRICVDSAPILERALAQKTRLGFVGKNSLYIHPKLGSYILLAEILTDLELETDVKPNGLVLEERSKVYGGCGSCQRCKVYCPTNALHQDYTVDARRCISYWTIEHRGLIPDEMWPHLKTYVFGCDLCQMVCPYNRDIDAVAHQPHLPRSLDLVKVATMDEKTYIELFGGTPLTRAKREGLRRNAIIGLAVTQDLRLGELLPILEADPSEVLRGTCAQARRLRYV